MAMDPKREGRVISPGVSLRFRWFGAMRAREKERARPQEELFD